MSMQRLLAALTALLLLLGCAAAETSGDYEYTLEGGKAVITAYSGTQTVLAVPAALDGHPVGAIGEWAFSGHYELSSITLPEGLAAIPAWLLRDCDSLTAVTVPDGAVSIGMDAFEFSDSLQRMTLPGSLTEISVFAFNDCPALTDVYFCGTQSQWDALAIDDFNEPLLNAALHFPAARPADVDLPEDLTVIERDAFADLAGGTVVYFPEGVAEIDDAAFPPADSADPIILIAHPGSYAEAWGVRNGYTVWFPAP